jgi:ATP phosphoribosyltransferase regulatory subunit
MNDPNAKDPAAPAADSLLPAGLHDVLPPHAAHEAATVEALTAVFAAQGYDRVKPPLIEFEDSLLSGAGAGLAKDTFRLMDPVSQRMMGVRADMTVQVARLATARLARQPRPLRLCYAGQVLRVKGDQLRPERQFAQAGAELIGVDSVEADAEIVCLAAEALQAVGVDRLSIDLTAPTLVTGLLDQADLAPAERAGLRHALDHKDAAGIAEAPGPLADQLAALLAATGPAAQAAARAASLSLPPDAAADRDRMVALIALLQERAPDLTLTVDWIEHRGFEYHTGIGFTVFARGVRGELGRGGRYHTQREPGVGLTLYLDSIMRAVPARQALARLYLPHGTPPSVGAAQREAGWITVAGLAPEQDRAAEARRLGCGHVWIDGAAQPVEGDGE